MAYVHRSFIRGAENATTPPSLLPSLQTAGGLRGANRTLIPLGARCEVDWHRSNPPAQQQAAELVQPRAELLAQHPLFLLLLLREIPKLEPLPHARPCPQQLAQCRQPRPHPLLESGGVEALPPVACRHAQHLVALRVREPHARPFLPDVLPHGHDVGEVEVLFVVDDDSEPCPRNLLHQLVVRPPHLHHHILSQSTPCCLEAFLPHHGGAGLGSNEITRVLHHVSESLCACHLVLLQPCFHPRRRVPALDLHLVSAEVEELVAEHLSEFVEESRCHLKRGVGRVRRELRGPDWTQHFDAVLSRTQVWHDPTPRLRMPGHVQLRHNPHAMQAAVLNHVLDLLLGVSLRWREGLLLAEERVSFEVKREGGAISDVPVEDVELGHRDGANRRLEKPRREVVPSRVEHHLAVGEARRILDCPRGVVDDVHSTKRVEGNKL
mmetsp:Transcript_27098/g.55183  ORF Transcript_27098/g.55183 Transcript_27098/m.55183 type:complete len:437 (-) Transcript_27098:1452-2762(-)